MFARFTAAAVLLVVSVPGLAHPDHDAAPPVANRSIAEKAQDAVLVQIARSKLDARWATAVPGKPEARTAAGKKTWVIPFRRPEGGNTLAVTLNDGGDFMSAAVSSQ